MSCYFQVCTGDRTCVLQFAFNEFPYSGMLIGWKFKSPGNINELVADAVSGCCPPADDLTGLFGKIVIIRLYYYGNKSNY